MMDGSDHTGIKCHCKVLTLNERGSYCKICLTVEPFHFGCNVEDRLDGG